VEEGQVEVILSTTPLNMAACVGRVAVKICPVAEVLMSCEQFCAVEPGKSTAYNYYSLAAVRILHTCSFPVPGRATSVRSKPVAVVPCTLHMNDIVNYETRYFGTEAYAADLKREFDVLYEEGAHRRRMMSVSAHDRVAGRPACVRVLEEFIQYAQSHPGVSFMRKVDIANYAIASPRTVREDI
jgi:hypothetical protein